jgi:hypothetical protein
VTERASRSRLSAESSGSSRKSRRAPRVPAANAPEIAAQAPDASSRLGVEAESPNGEQSRVSLPSTGQQGGVAPIWRTDLTA